MRVVVTGATGNVGSAVVRALAADEAVEEVVGLARRRPGLELERVSWRIADVASDRLDRIFAGADAVVHLAWAIQPSRNEPALRAVNVDGSRRVFDATARAGVETLVYASSVGAYSKGPKHSAVDESWPTGGVESSFYSRHKATVEADLDRFEAAHPGIRVVRLRPGLIFSAAAAVGIRRLFLGPLFPRWAASPSRIPIVPDVDSLRFQAVHTEDVAEAYRSALHADAAGPINVAAQPVLDADVLAVLLGARKVALPASVLRAAAAAGWRLRLQPTSPGWIDLALSVPIMDTGCARRVLGWRPRRSSTEALLDLLSGIRSGAGYPTPPLDPGESGAARWREFASGVGAKGPRAEKEADSGSPRRVDRVQKPIQEASMAKKARDVMTPDAQCVGENDSVAEAARRLSQLGVGAMPICGEDDRLKGMITDRDIVVEVLAEGKDPESTKAGELGDGKPVTIGADDSLGEALQTMKEHKIRRLPVIDGHDLVGIVSIADLATNVDDEETGDLIEAISAAP